MVPVLTLWLALVAAQSTTSPETPKPATRAEQAAILARTPCDPNSTENKLGMKGMTNPQVTHQVEPDFIEQTRGIAYRQGPLIQLTVDPNGVPVNVHILTSPSDTIDAKDKSAALALVRKFIDTIAQMRFKPATCQGKPVSSQLVIETSWRMF